MLELSIVLMIVGLIVAGIVVARSMIRQGEIRNALGEEDQYIKAIKEFQDKYSALPGDMTTAESIWGSDASCPNTAYNTIAKTATCNGNGDGLIGNSNSIAYLSNTTEWWRAWQQLSDAKLVKDTFTGAQGVNAPNEAAIGVNVPASDLDGAGWTMLYYQLQCNGDLWSDEYGHLLALGGYQKYDYTRAAVLTPGEALVMDQKVDDGKPGTGKLRAWRQTVLPNCTINDTSQPAQSYNASYSGGMACSLVFLMGF